MIYSLFLSFCFFFFPTFATKFLPDYRFCYFLMKQEEEEAAAATAADLRLTHSYYYFLNELVKFSLITYWK